MTDPERDRLTVRVAAYGLVLHGLLERLRLAGTIDDRDITNMRERQPPC
jgi:hypothetical protein